VAGAAGLPGLARETRKRLRLRRKANCQQGRRGNDERDRREYPETTEGSSNTTDIAPHCALSRFLQRFVLTHESKSHFTGVTIVHELDAWLR